MTRFGWLIAVVLVLAIAFILWPAWRQAQWDGALSDVDAYLKQGDAARALSSAQELVELRPRSYHSWWWLGRAHATDKDYAAAERAYRRAAKLEPESAEVHFQLGQMLDMQDRYAEAVTEYRDAVELDPGYAVAWAELADSLWALRRPGDAIAPYRRAISLNPELLKARAMLASALVQTDRQQEALQVGRDLVEAAPGFALGHWSLAAAYIGTDDLEEAIYHYRRAATLAGENPLLQESLILALAMDGQLEEALREARQRYEEAPQEMHGEAAAIVAFVLIFQGKLDLATEYLRDPQEGGSHGAYLRTRALAHAGRVRDATAQARTLVEHYPEDPVARSLLAETLALAERFDEAAREIERTIALRPRPYPIDRAVAAYILAASGQRGEAREHLAALADDLDMHAVHMGVLHFSGLAYRELGETERSNELFRRAIDRWPKHPWSQQMREMMG